LRIVVLEELRDDAELRRCWNKLVQHMESPQVFYTYEWAQAVDRAYGNLLRPVIVLAYEGESLVGIVAFAREKAAQDAVVFLTGNTADYCDFLSEPARRHEFVSAVFSELKRREITKVTLVNLPANSSSVAAIHDAASNCHYHLFSRPAYMCARVVLESTGQRAALKQVTTSKKTLRRYLRTLQKKGRVVFRHDERWEEIEPTLESFEKAHVARFLATGRISNVSRGERRVFLRELARSLSRSGWMTMSRLLVGDVPVAWNYGFQFAGSWFWYQPTFDSTYEGSSPGFCLLSNIVETACDRPDIEIVDLGLGAEGYKDRFATSNRQTLHLVLHQAFPSHLHAVMRYHAATVAKASPRVETWIRGPFSSVTRLSVRLRGTRVSGMLRWLVQRIWHSLFAFDEVLFFSWPQEAHVRRESGGPALRPLDFDLLGAAGIHYADDPAAELYLMRSAQRFRSEHDRGFALVTAEGTPVHFCWVKDFEGFEMEELGRILHAPGPEAVMIFDCFTPALARGKGFLSEAIAALASQLQAAGKAPWIFAAATNQASVRGIEKSGFTCRFSLGRKRFLFLNQEKDSGWSPSIANVAGGPSR
jgi:CelD/BcsL family acetyltransferase involved in cellulose biosynthesis